MDVNSVRLIGRLGKEPVIKYTGSGKCVANFSVATKYKESVDWHSCVAWEREAEKFKDVEKGTTVEVIGRLQTRKWTDRQGQTRYTTEVIAHEILIGGNHGNSSSGNAGSSNTDFDPFQ